MLDTSCRFLVGPSSEAWLLADIQLRLSMSIELCRENMKIGGLHRIISVLGYGDQIFTRRSVSV